LSFFISFFCYYFAEKIMVLIYSSEYIGSGIYLKILSPAVAIGSFILMFGIALVSTNNQRVDFLSTVIALLGLSTLSLAAIPYYKQIGAAWAFLISLIIFGIGQILYIRKTNISNTIGWPMLARVILIGLGIIFLFYTFPGKRTFEVVVVGLSIFILFSFLFIKIKFFKRFSEILSI